MIVPPPPDPAILDQGFPRHRLRAGTLLYRVHRASHEAAFFGDDGLSRFDMVGSGVGVCYLGLRDETAFLEVFGRQQPITTQLVAERRVSELALSGDVILADLTNNQVVGKFGLTLEVSAGGDYAGPQAWSRALHTAGFGGLLYKARHAPGAELESVALFGKPGVDDSLMVENEVRAIGRDLLDRMKLNYGFPDPVPSRPLK
jgi:hypothetical protein